jgi:methylthioribose-1-phosphate isomerase
LHIWIDETRPLNQGSRLTAWEMYNEGIDFSIITDNAGGMLMQNGNVDLVITGADRIAQNGDTANKIGTYLKALAAMENKVPFYIAAPSSTIDINTENGDLIIIEERNPKEVSHIIGLTSKDKLEEVRIVPDNYKIYNPAFDITPHNLITGIITEKGIFKTDELASKFS